MYKMDTIVQYDKDSKTYIVDDGYIFYEISEELLDKLIKLRDENRSE